MQISVFHNETEKRVSKAAKAIETDVAVVRPVDNVNSVSHFCCENISQSTSTDI